jgi:prepilin-type N-terminal cleavage/methylation domain-containing protein
MYEKGFGGMTVDSTKKKQTKAFTLIELLVVISIIALLMAIFLPGFQKARRSAKEIVCVSNLHQVAIAALSYENDNTRLPLHYCENPGGSPRGAWSEQLASNYNQIDRRELWLPYIPDLNFLNCPLLKSLDIRVESVPIQSRRVYCGYALMIGYWRDRDESGQWGNESKRWARTDQPWNYQGRRIDVLAGDRFLQSVSASYYRLNHGLRLGVNLNYVDFDDPLKRGYIVSVYEGYGTVDQDLRRKTTAAYCFKDGSAEKFRGDDIRMFEIFEPPDQRGDRVGSHLVPLR